MSTKGEDPAAGRFQRRDLLVVLVDDDVFAGRQQALQYQAGARAFHNFMRAGLVGKRMKNQRRKLVGYLSVLHGCLRGQPQYGELMPLCEQYFSLN